MHVLVTGGAGYIGSTLIKQLLEKEHKVVSIDNLSRGDYKFLMKYKENPRLKLLIGDIRDPDKLKDVIEENRDVDVIVPLVEFLLPRGVRAIGEDENDGFGHLFLLRVILPPAVMCRSRRLLGLRSPLVQG